MQGNATFIGQWIISLIVLCSYGLMYLIQKRVQTDVETNMRAIATIHQLLADTNLRVRQLEREPAPHETAG